VRMRSFVLLLALLACILLVAGQGTNDTNPSNGPTSQTLAPSASTMSMAPSTATTMGLSSPANMTKAAGGCANDCTQRGICTPKGNISICFCFYGFFGRDCSVTMATVNPQLWNLFRGFLGTYFSINFILCVVGYFFSRTDLSSTANITRLGLVIWSILQMMAVLFFSVDPYGMVHPEIPYVIICLFDGVRQALAYCIFVVILFHWVELYSETLKRLDHAEMIAKIRSDLNRDVTLDEILQNVKNVHRFRIPCAVVVIFFIVFRAIGMILRGVRSPTWLPMQTAFNALIFAAYAITAFGFIYFGRKLYSLFPRPFSNRMKKTTITIVALTFAECAVFLLFFIYFLVIIGPPAVYTPANINSWFAGEFMLQLCICTVAVWVQAVFNLPMYERIGLYLKSFATGSHVSGAGNTDISL